MVLYRGSRDWLGMSAIDASVRLVLDSPRQLMYENMGGRLDVEELG